VCSLRFALGLFVGCFGFTFGFLVGRFGFTFGRAGSAILLPKLPARAA
jgi:hypothetical protein